MSVLFVLLVGAPLWWFATGQTDTVRTMGRGGPFVYLAVWLFVAVLVARHLAARARFTLEPERPTMLRSLLGAYAVAIGVVVGLAFALGAARVSGTAFQASLLAGAFLLVCSAPLVLLAAWLTARCRDRRRRRRAGLRPASCGSRPRPDRRRGRRLSRRPAR